MALSFIPPFSNLSLGSELRPLAYAFEHPKTTKPQQAGSMNI